MCREITKKNKAWNEVADMVDVSVENTELVQLACFADQI